MNTLIITLLSVIWLLVGYFSGASDVNYNNLFLCLFVLGVCQIMAYIYECS